MEVDHCLDNGNFKFGFVVMQFCRMFSFKLQNAWLNNMGTNLNFGV